jgi:hypothetical protein
MAMRKKPNLGKTKKTSSLRQLYARLRKEFTAADLQKYTEIEEGVPLEKVVAEMEVIYRQYEQNRK